MLPAHVLTDQRKAGRGRALRVERREGREREAAVVRGAARSMPNLTVITGPAGETLEVQGELVIGREHYDLDLADPEVSRRHAALRVVDEGVEVTSSEIEERPPQRAPSPALRRASLSAP